MNRLVWVMLVFLVVCTIAIGLISCGAKDRTEPNEPAISDGTQDDDSPNSKPDDQEEEEEEEEPEKEEEKEESKPDVPTVNPPSSGGGNTWTPPVYVPPTSVITPPQDTDTADKNVVYSKAGTYSTPAVYQDVTIESKGVILSNKTVNGDLVITEDVGTGDVYLTNVSVDGVLYVYGGGENSIHLDDVTANKIVVDKGRKGRVRLVASGKTEVNLVEAYSGVILKESGINRNFEGFIDITTKPGNNLSSVQITLYGCDIDEIYALEETTLSIRSGCEIGLVNGSKENITVTGEWDAIDAKKGDVDRGSSGSGGGGGGSSSKDRIPTPKNLDYTFSGSRILVEWDSVSKADDYTIKVNGKTKDVKYYDYLGTDITDMIPEGRNDLEVEVRANRDSSGYKDSHYSSTLHIKNVVKAKPVTGAVLSHDAANNALKVNWQYLGDSYTDHLEVVIVNKANNDVVFSNYSVPATNTEVSFPLTSTTRGSTTYIAKITSVPKASGTEIGIAPEPVTASGEYTHVVKEKLPAPANLQILSYNDSTRKVSLKWDAVLGAASYDVYKKVGASGAETFVTNVTAAKADVTLTEADCKDSVSFTVKAKDTDPQYTSDPSAECILSKLAKPVISSAEFADGTVTLKWNAVDGASSYEVQMDSAVVSSNITFSGSTAAITGVSAEKHTFSVRAKGSKAISSDYSDPKELETLAKPTGLTISYDPATSSAALNWTAVDGASGYEILLDNTAAPSVIPPVQGTTVTIQNVSSSNHTFRVRAVATGKIPSEYSEATLTKLASPANVRFDSASSQITWDAVEKTSGYEIYKDSSAVPHAVIAANSYKATESGQYTIVAVGTGSVISSEKSAPVTVSIQTTTQLPAPQVTLEKNGESFQLKISAPGASGVTVSDGSQNLTVTGSAPDFTAQIPLAEAAYTIKAVGSAALLTTDSPETHISIRVISNTPSLTLGQDGILRVSGRNAQISLNGTPAGTSVNLSDKPAGDYAVTASAETFAEGYQIFQGGEVQQTYTVKEAAKPTAKPSITKAADSDNYILSFSKDANYTYQYQAALSYTDQRTPTTKELIVTADGKISAVQIQQPGDPIVSSFTVTVTATPVNALAISGNAVTRYTGYTLTSEPFTIPAQTPPGSQEPASPEQTEPTAPEENTPQTPSSPPADDSANPSLEK